MPLSLRPTFPQDEPFLSQLLYDHLYDKLMAHVWDAHTRDAVLKMQIEGQRSSYAIQYPQAPHAIIVLDDRPIGRLIVDRGPQFHHLVDITIAKKHRGAGIGTILVRSLCIEAEMMRKPMRLYVSTDNRARALYLRLGFRMIEDLQMDWLMERAPGASQLITP